MEILKEKIKTLFFELIQIVQKLRGPDGCPWDLKQTSSTLIPHLIEESHEVIEAIRSNEADSLAEELGDLLFQIVFHVQIATEKGNFDFQKVLETITQKMVRRHPHVFSQMQSLSTDEISHQWESIKQKEKKKDSVLDGIPPGLPALQKAYRLGQKAASVGFDWVESKEVLKKVREELDELDQALQTGTFEQKEEEFGDFLFSISQWGRHLKIHPEETLQRSCLKFQKRFVKVEKMAMENKKSMKELSSEELEELWKIVKQNERNDL